ncbi:MAG: hypothetical protein KC469_10130 [Flavobacteriaceae bacterium]|nr:hypothetical protein [Flavobacteriaceae bacterium]
MKLLKLLFTILLMFSLTCHAQAQKNLGMFFDKKSYSGQSIPSFEKTKHLLPVPIFDNKPEYIDFYYKAWEIGFDHFKAPQKSSPLVSNYIDEAFNENIFLWDMSFSTMWGNYAHHIFPSIEGLDNFYRNQLPDGEIVREIGEKDGHLGVIGWSEPGTEGNLNHPILPWAELESFKTTANKNRLERVYLPLKKYRESFKKIYHKQSGLYLTDKAAMDDSPRNDQLLAGIDVAAEMVIFDYWLAEIATILNKPTEATFYNNRASEYSRFINNKLWDEKTGFYYDWGKDNKRMTMRTIAAFWTLLGKIPNEQQKLRLIEHLNNPNSFNTKHRVPTHPADEVGFNGDYWAGAVWVPTNTMIIQGLEINDEFTLAREIAMNHLNATTQVFLETGTAWENYHPLAWKKGQKAKPDFIGWSGLAPINYLIKHAIGIRINAPKNEIIWRINETSRHGINGLRFNTYDNKMNSISLVAAKRESLTEDIIIASDCEKPFTLKVHIGEITKSFDIACNTNSTLRIKIND